MEDKPNGYRPPPIVNLRSEAHDRLASDELKRTGEQVRWFGYIAVGIAIVSGLVGIAVVVYLTVKMFR